MTKSAGTAPGETRASDLIAVIRRAPALRQEAEACLPALEAALTRRASEEEIVIALVEHAPAYGINVQEGAPEEWAARWKVYVNTLAEFSGEVLDAAFLAWDRGEVVADKVAKSFYPRPPQLHDACVLARNQLSQMRHRIRAALNDGPPPPRKIDPAERAQVAADLAALAKGIGGGRVAPPEAQRPMGGSPAQVAERLRAAGVPMNRPKPPTPDDEVIL